jgi:hypothetical protein
MAPACIRGSAPAGDGRVVRADVSGAALVFALIGSAAMPAEPPISASTLERYCQAFTDEPGSQAGRRCVLYVRGFVDAVAASEHSAPDESESWTERAARTRLSGRYRAQVMKPDTACLAERRAMGKLVVRVLGRLRATASQRVSAQEVVHEVIRERSPCAD